MGTFTDNWGLCGLSGKSDTMVLNWALCKTGEPLSAALFYLLLGVIVAGHIDWQCQRAGQLIVQHDCTSHKGLRTGLHSFNPLNLVPSILCEFEGWSDSCMRFKIVMCSFELSRVWWCLTVFCSRTQINTSGQFLRLVGMRRVTFCWYARGVQIILPGYVCRAFPYFIYPAHPAVRCYLAYKARG
jgi:hypothetical protein